MRMLCGGSINSFRYQNQRRTAALYLEYSRGITIIAMTPTAGTSVTSSQALFNQTDNPSTKRMKAR